MSGRTMTYAPTAIGGVMLAEAINHIRAARDIMNRANALMNAVTSANSNDLASLEGSVEFGVSAGNGSLFYTSVNNMNTTLSGCTDGMIASLDMGG